jgi:hypothetical protein
MIAQTVNAGSPQVTAKVIVLGDLGEVPTGFFDPAAADGDAHPLQTVLLDETSLRNNLLSTGAVAWPPLKDGPLVGNVTTQVVVDRNGIVRETGTVVSENPGVNETGLQAARSMRFKPFLANGVPVQAISQVTIPFKTVRPAGVEVFESARTYFERGRKAGFLSGGTGKPYTLRAEFTAITALGTNERGRYEDTWVSKTKWRREAWFGTSHYVRSRNEEKSYQLAEGPDAALLRTILKITEPIPALDTFVESDWRIKRDVVNNNPTVRVLTGYESPEGKLDVQHARGYWFDGTGQLVKTYFSGMETVRSEFVDFDGVAIARSMDVLKDGLTVIQINVTAVESTPPARAQGFEISGHEWVPAFTDEAR